MSRALQFAQAAVATPDADDPDQERRTRRLLDLWIIAWESDAMPLATEAVGRARTIAAGMPDSQTKAKVLYAAATDMWSQGRHYDSSALYDASMAVASAVGDEQTWADSASVLAHTVAESQARGGRGAMLVDAVLSLELRFDGAFWQYWRVVDLIQALWALGRWTFAVELGRRATDAARRYGLEDRYAPWLWAGDPLIELGRYDEIEAAMKRESGSHVAVHSFNSNASLAVRTCVAQGRIAEARAAAGQWPEIPGVSAQGWRLESAVVLARAEHRFDAVRAAVDELLGMAASDDAYGPTWFTLWPAIGAAADEATTLRRRRRADEAAAAAADGAAWLAQLAALRVVIDADGGPGPFLGAVAVAAEAEALRAADQPSIDAWQEAVDRWVSLGHPYQTAYSQFRLAEAMLDAGDAQHEAAANLAYARAGASGLGAAGLLAEIDALAGRARIRVVPAVDAPDPARRGTKATSARLTERERAILALVAAGHTNREIGGQLFISEKTVSVHVSNAMGKLDALSRYEAAAIAEREGLLQI
jgi:DNA-binding CsgD family transcriptional regulator